MLRLLRDLRPSKQSPSIEAPSNGKTHKSFVRSRRTQDAVPCGLHTGPPPRTSAESGYKCLRTRRPELYMAGLLCNAIWDRNLPVFDPLPGKKGRYARELRRIRRMGLSIIFGCKCAVLLTASPRSTSAVPSGTEMSQYRPFLRLPSSGICHDRTIRCG